MNSLNWPVRDRFFELHSQWLTLIGEHLDTPTGQTLEYWRVEKADSLIVLPIYEQSIFLPPPVYRPGLGETTLDFPGGRFQHGEDLHTTAQTILNRELGIDGAIAYFYPLNAAGWPVNSSFSNQRLFGVVAELSAYPLSSVDVITYPLTNAGIQDLLEVLTCLQCRSVLLQWWMTQLGVLRR
ncbi:MAG: NUDIX hydrolase [Synechococcales cyanobacterium T60_A2020_003]|nr:NUDIX hydrolase [Synechococcales cyanobacterium T60_A2020_003]